MDALRSLSLFFALIASTSPIHPAADRLAILDLERASWRSLSFAAQIETPKPGGRRSRIEMQFDFEAPNNETGQGGDRRHGARLGSSGKYRSEMKMGIEGDIITVADGTTIWSQMSRTREVFRQSERQAEQRLKAMGPVDPITAITTPSVPLSELYSLIAATSGVDGRWILELRPIKTVSNYDKVLLTTTFDGKTPLTAEAFKRGKTVAVIRFKTFRRNVAVSRSLFVFTVPRGFRVTEI